MIPLRDEVVLVLGSVSRTSPSRASYKLIGTKFEDVDAAFNPVEVQVQDGVGNADSGPTGAAHRLVTVGEASSRWMMEVLVQAAGGVLELKLAPISL
jgi:hypothetical protein